MAQAVERELGALPEHVLKAVLTAAKGNPVRAREIAKGVNEIWWYRWVAMMEQKVNAENGNE